MNNLRECAPKGRNIAFSVSVFSFVAVMLDITQARVLPFLLNQRKIYDLGGKPEADGSVAFDKVWGTRGVLEKFGYIEFVPNGTVILRSTMENGSNRQNLLLFKSVLGAMQISPRLGVSNDMWNIKIYGEGTEHKFPPFLERIIQRVQTYFSVYKYTDTSAVESAAMPGENINIQVAGTPMPGMPSVNPSRKDENNHNESVFSRDKTDLEQPPTILGVESMMPEENNEYTEFISIGEHDADFIVGDGD